MRTWTKLKEVRQANRSNASQQATRTLRLRMGTGSPKSSPWNDRKVRCDFGSFVLKVRSEDGCCARAHLGAVDRVAVVVEDHSANLTRATGAHALMRVDPGAPLADAGKTPNCS
eukprot:36265-Pleurochrysis_carterae.AAC.2